MSAANKALVQRLWDELVNNGNLSGLADFASPDFVDHTPLPGESPGLEGLRQRFVLLHSAFPDFQSTIEDMIAEGDKVVARVRSSGTHLAPFIGMPATGKRWTIMEIHILRMAGAKLIEHWGMPDFFGMLVQLGFASAPWQGASEQQIQVDKEPRRIPA